MPPSLLCQSICLLFGFAFYSLVTMLDAHAGYLQVTPIHRVAFCYRQQPTTNPSCHTTSQPRRRYSPSYTGTVLTPSATAEADTSKTYRNILCKNKNALISCSHIDNKLLTSLALDSKSGISANALVAQSTYDMASLQSANAPQGNDINPN